MSESLATAYVQVIPTTEGIGSSLGSMLSGEASSAGDQAGQAAGDSLASKMKSVLVAAGIGLAIKTAVGSVTNAIKEVAAAGDEIDKTSQKMGVSAKQYQAMSFAAEHCGFSTSVFNTAVKKLQASGYDGTIADYMNSLMKIKDPSERAAKAQQDLGERVANEMAAFINGGQSLDDYQNKLEDLGGMMSNESVSAAAAYADAMTDMHTAMDGLVMQTSSQLLPGIAEIMNGIASLVSGDQGGIAQIGNGISNLASAIGKAVPQLVTAVIGICKTALSAIISNAPEWITTGFTMLGNFVTGLLNNLPNLITTAGNLITKLISKLMDGAPKILKSGFDLIGKMAQGLVKNIPAIVTSIAQVIAKLLATIGSKAPEMITTAFNLIGKMASGIIKAVPTVVASIPKVISGIKNAFTSINWGEIGSNIIKGIANGIKNAAGSILSAAKDAAKSALNAAKNALGIHSPSRVFRDEVGKQIMAGWAEGLTDNADLLNSTMDDINNELTRGINTTVNAKSSDGTEEALLMLARMFKSMPEEMANAMEGMAFKVGERDFGKMVRRFA